MITHDRTVQPAAQPRLVTRLGLAARLQLKTLKVWARLRTPYLHTSFYARRIADSKNRSRLTRHDFAAGPVPPAAPGRRPERAGALGALTTASKLLAGQLGSRLADPLG
eukprot:scaffold26039_cov107-Phaeocystis_antarctica.AAC.2